MSHVHWWSAVVAHNQTHMLLVLWSSSLSLVLNTLCSSIMACSSILHDLRRCIDLCTRRKSVTIEARQQLALDCHVTFLMVVSLVDDFRALQCAAVLQRPKPQCKQCVFSVVLLVEL
eukprot:8801-Heterococcus_DN1.PRE.2